MFLNSVATVRWQVVRHVLNCSVAENSRFSSMELSMCLQNLSAQCGNSSSYWNVVFIWSTGQWKMSTNWVINRIFQNSFGNLARSYVHLWKATITCIMSVCFEWLGSHFASFHDNFFGGKFAEKIQFLLKSDTNNGHFTWRRTYIFDLIFLSSF